MSTAQSLAAEGIASAGRHAGTEWILRARGTVREFAASEIPFTASDVQASLPPAAEPRALGGVIRWAHRNGVIEPTGRWVTTDRAASHGRPEREWVGR